MPTPQELRAEIESGPLSATLAPLVAAGRDADVAAALNARAFPGYVPCRHALAVLLSDATGWGAGLVWMWRHGRTPAGDPVTGPACVLLARLFAGAELPEYGFRLPVADIEAGCAALSAPPPVAAAMLAGEVKISRAEVAWGYGAAVSADDVARALRG